MRTRRVTVASRHERQPDFRRQQQRDTVGRCAISESYGIKIFDDQPVVLFSEIGSDNYERPKVGEYRDGALDYADGERATGKTLLGDQEIPSLEEVNADGGFSGEAIDAVAFETVWNQATGG